VSLSLALSLALGRAGSASGLIAWQLLMIGLEAFYIAGLATLAGYLLIGRVPSVLFTPLLAGAGFVHGIVLVGALLLLGSAEGRS